MNRSRLSRATPEQNMERYYTKLTADAWTVFNEDGLVICSLPNDEVGEYYAHKIVGALNGPADPATLNELGAYLLHALGEAAPHYERTEWPKAANGTKTRWRHIARRVEDLMAARIARLRTDLTLQIRNSILKVSTYDGSNISNLDEEGKEFLKRLFQLTGRRAADVAMDVIELAFDSAQVFPAKSRAEALERVATAATIMVDDFRNRTGSGTNNMNQLMEAIDALRRWPPTDETE